MPKQSHRSASTRPIRPLTPDDLQAVIDLSLSAWEPVFASFENILGAATFEHLYRPDWREAQAAEVRKNCLAEACESFVSTTDDGVVVGFVVLGQDDDQSLGMVEMIAVHPAHQRRGHARARQQWRQHSLTPPSGQGMSVTIVR